MISLRREIDESAQLTKRMEAMRQAFLRVAAALPDAALPANPALSAQCKENIGYSTATLNGNTSAAVIDEAGEVAVQQIAEIRQSNAAALQERDSALKEVATAVAGAVSSFKSTGQRQNTDLNRLADGFEAIARVEDVNELRQRLCQDVSRLRQKVEEMNRENQESFQRFETQVSDFQQRLEAARKGSGVDQLTGIGSRREAERQLLSIPGIEKPVCLLLFDIEGFGAINKRRGTMFADKLLRALSHLLREKFPEEGALFRWAADEFMVIAEGSLKNCQDQCRNICERFGSGGGFYAVDSSGNRVPLQAGLASGAAQYVRGENVEELHRRARSTMEQNRKGNP